VLRLALASAMAGAGCSGARSPSAAAPPDLAQAQPQPQPDLGAAPIPVVSVLRCEECHGKIAARWRLSAHARADSAPFYVAMRAKAGAAGECDRCHAPFVGHADPAEPGGHEGVNCDTCHSIAAVEPRPEGAGFVLRTQDNVKLGPLCDAKDHYFHKMGCSPLHGEGRFCAACHLYTREVPGARLPVFTEYAEWRDGPAAAEGLECQSCHMPAVKGLEVARGWKPRPFAHDHGLLGADQNLRRRALRLRLEVSAAAGVVHVAATITNVGAGHAVPSGLPGRRVLLRVRCLDRSGREQSHAEREYARVLGDAAGHEVPFYAATRLVSDDRLQPRVPHEEAFDLPATQSGSVQVELLWRPLPARWSEELGVAPPADELMAAAKVPFVDPAATAHAAPRRIVTVEPSR
jgi:hypothetical protein